MKRRASPFALGLAYLALFFTLEASSACAQAGKLRAGMWGPVPQALRARVMGQVSDLPWEFVELPAAFDGRRDESGAPCGGADSIDVVWWAERDATPAYTLWVVQCDARRRALRRQFAPMSESRGDRSAAVEALSLALRGVLQAIESGEDDSVFTPDVAPSPSKYSYDKQNVESHTVALPAVADTPVEPVQIEAPRPLPDSTGLAPHMRLGMLGVAALDGFSPVGVFGAQLDFALHILDEVTVTAHLGADLPKAVRLQKADVELQRSVALLGLAARLLGDGGVAPQLWLGVRAGAALLRRATGEVAAGLEATDPRRRSHWLFLVAGALTGSWPLWADEATSVQLLLQAELQYWPARFIVLAERVESTADEGSAAVARKASWSVQPRMLVGLGLTF